LTCFKYSTKKVITCVSSGLKRFKGKRRGGIPAAIITAQRLISKLLKLNVRKVNINIYSNLKPQVLNVVRSFFRSPIRVCLIRFLPRIPHGFRRIKKQRRI
jgi:ribosomal protein S11